MHQANRLDQSDKVRPEENIEIKAQVFLGGACGTTTWRREIAIPLLEAAGVSYHNPQLGPGEWTEACEAEEMRAKAEAEVQMFVVTEETRGVASVAEVGYLIGSGQSLAFCLRMLPGKDPEVDDLNRGRIFVRTMAKEHGVPVFEACASAPSAAHRPRSSAFQMSKATPGSAAIAWSTTWRVSGDAKVLMKL